MEMFGLKIALMRNAKEMVNVWEFWALWKFLGEVTESSFAIKSQFSALGI